MTENRYMPPLSSSVFLLSTVILLSGWSKTFFESTQILQTPSLVLCYQFAKYQSFRLSCFLTFIFYLSVFLDKVLGCTFFFLYFYSYFFHLNFLIQTLTHLKAKESLNVERYCVVFEYINQGNS